MLQSLNTQKLLLMFLDNEVTCEKKEYLRQESNLSEPTAELLALKYSYIALVSDISLGQIVPSSTSLQTIKQAKNWPQNNLVHSHATGNKMTTLFCAILSFSFILSHHVHYFSCFTCTTLALQSFKGGGYILFCIIAKRDICPWLNGTIICHSQTSWNYSTPSNLFGAFFEALKLSHWDRERQIFVSWPSSVPMQQCYFHNVNGFPFCLYLFSLFNFCLL